MKVDNEKKEQKEPTLNDIVQGMRFLMGKLTAVDDRFKSYEQRLAATDQRFEAIKTKPEEKKEEKSAAPKDIDSLSNSELVSHMLEQVKGVLEPVTKRIVELDQRTERGSLKNELDKLITQDPDTLEYKDEIKEIMSETPGLSLTRALAIAKTESRDKTAALDGKRAEAKAAEDAKKAAEAAEDFGGFMPTSSRVSTPGDKKMNSEEAAEKAWQDTFGGTPWDREFNLDRSN